MKFLTVLSAAVAALVLSSSAFAAHSLFMKSAVENSSLSQVTLPLYKGTSGSQDVWYVITDSSSRGMAKSLGVNFAPRLKVARNTAAVQYVTYNPDGTINFPATVDFSANRTFLPDPSWYVSDDHPTTTGSASDELGLPFAMAPTAGAVGNSGYSPLIQLPEGTILNASHVSNPSGHADKASNINTAGIRGSVTLEETAGFFGGHTIHYISVDASVVPGADLEDVTFASKLQNVPGGDPTIENTVPKTSARAGIIAFTNGQFGLGNPKRQGLGSTLVDAASVPGATGVNPTNPPPVPLNIIQAVPVDRPDSLYTPLWDVHLTRWDPTKVPYDQRLRQRSFGDVQALDEQGLLTQPDGTGHFGPTGRSASNPTIGGVVANCPIISTDGVGDENIPPPN